MSDFKCDMDCPNVPGIGEFKGICCFPACRTARRSHVNESNAHLWTDEKGFWGDNGCKLPREQMPAECRQYDCKHRGFYVCTVQYAVTTYDGNKWVQSPISQNMMVGWAGKDEMNMLTLEIHRRLERRNHEILGFEYSNEQDPAKAH